jgi:glycosyltransferase involved in cell wall biosynthesis
MAGLKPAMSKKILIVTNIPTPYRIPLFNQLDSQMRRAGLSLKVIFGARGYPRRRWKIDLADCRFEHEILPSRIYKFAHKEKTLFTYRGLLPAIKREKPAAVVVSGFSLGSMKVWLYSLLSSLPYFIWSGDTPRTTSFSFTRGLQRKLLIKRAKGFIAYGSKARDYLIALGADPRSVSISINTVDTEYFMSSSKQLREMADSRLRHDSQKHVLSVGDLIPRKNMAGLLRIFKLIAATRADVVLDIVGDGPQRKWLESYVHENRLEPYVQFHGFQQKTSLAHYYAATDCFVFQTDFDIWGLVLNEAMAAGIPSIASINAGATHDLIKDGVTGFAMDFLDVQAVSNRIGWLLDNPDQARRIGDNARLFVEQNATLETSASSFIRALGVQ